MARKQAAAAAAAPAASSPAWRDHVLRDLDARIGDANRYLAAARPTDKGRVSYLRGKIDAYEQLRASLQEQQPPYPR